MTGKICHLCGTHYNDDPYFTEQPAHTPQKCIGILQYRYNEAELKFRGIERALVHAKMQYTKEGKLRKNK